jgi:hypothetical protein
MQGTACALRGDPFQSCQLEPLPQNLSRMGSWSHLPVEAATGVADSEETS